MLNFTEGDVRTTAERLLALNPDPVPRIRLLRDVLQLDASEAVYHEAAEALQTSKWVNLLANSQLPDGTWGRFHSQNTKVKQAFPTTETAVVTALDSGLDKQSLVLQKLTPTLLAYMSGQTKWPDPPEKHDNPLAWFVWEKHYSAAVLASFDTYHPALDEFWNIWANAVEAMFNSGAYNRQDEITALNVLFKCQMKNPFPIFSRYPLLILSAANHQLPRQLELRLLDFLMHSAVGIYYTCQKEINALPAIESRDFWPWFCAHRLLSRFRLWPDVSVQAVNWIWEQRTPDGFWDVGSQIARKPFTCFPLSESWRRPVNRIIDGSVEMLVLLARYFSGAHGTENEVGRY